MAEREVNMRRITKRRLSSLLCAVLMLITSIDVAAFAAGSDASKRNLYFKTTVSLLSSDSFREETDVLMKTIMSLIVV